MFRCTSWARKNTRNSRTAGALRLRSGQALAPHEHDSHLKLATRHLKLKQVATKTKPDLLRRLPSVDELLREPAIAALAATNGHAATADAARAVLARLREEIGAEHLD